MSFETEFMEEGFDFQNDAFPPAVNIMLIRRGCPWIDVIFSGLLLFAFKEFPNLLLWV